MLCAVVYLIFSLPEDLQMHHLIFSLLEPYDNLVDALIYHSYFAQFNSNIAFDKLHIE